MALVFFDGFDHYATAQATAKGWSQAPNAMGTGRFGGQSFQFSGGSGTTPTKNLPSTYATIIGGFAFQSNNLGVGPNEVFVFMAGAATAFRVQINTASKLLQILNSGGTIIATGTTVLNINTWYYVEVKCFINGASGTCELHLNGTSGEIASTVGNFGSVNISAIRLGRGSSSTPSVLVDDVYACDTTGADNNTFLGDVRVATLMPSGAGTHTQWTPLANANWQEVDETTPDDDTSYNSDSNVGDIDTFVTPGIDAASTVYGVQTNLYARKDDTGSRQIADVIRQGGTDTVGTTDTLASTYAFYSQLHDKDPTGADWTAAHVNADEFGYKLVA